MKNKNYILMDGKQTIESVKSQFNAIYPYLKIEFFKISHEFFKGSHRRNMYLMNESISSIESKHNELKVVVDKKTNVNTLEAAFETLYGLHVQVFRKSGNVWLETSLTDSWTLEKQNEEGKSLEEHFRLERENLNDHDVW